MVSVTNPNTVSASTPVLGTVNTSISSSIAGWGSYSTNAPTGNVFRSIATAIDAFAALDVNGAVKVWGQVLRGGTGGPTANGYVTIASTNQAFAALKSDSSIAVWGNSAYGGTTGPTGTGYVAIASTNFAFAALKSDGSIVPWGDPAYGGTGAPSGTGFTAIAANNTAFAALRTQGATSGTISVWGNSAAGGTTGPTGSGYVAIASTVGSFAALKSDNSISVWGNSAFGGTGGPTGIGYTAIASNYGAFAALDTRGAIAVWGSSTRGGTGGPTGTGYQTIASTYEAFAALDVCGAIAVWGNSAYGGTTGPTGTGYQKIAATYAAFAALKENGSISVWGDANYGGATGPTGTGFTSIASSQRAFAALDACGAIAVWGVANYGGAMGPTGIGYTTIASSATAFAALRPFPVLPTVTSVLATIPTGEVVSGSTDFVTPDGIKYTGYVIKGSALTTTVPPLTNYPSGSTFAFLNNGQVFKFPDGALVTSSSEVVDSTAATQAMWVPKTATADYNAAVENGRLAYNPTYQLPPAPTRLLVDAANEVYIMLQNWHLVVDDDYSQVCFLGDAPILTPTGYKRIDSLQTGDKVLTADGRAVPIVLISKKATLPGPSANPYIIPQGQWGAFADLHLSPAHRVKVPGRGMFRAENLKLQQAEMTAPWVYYNLMLPNWQKDNLVAAGLTVESLAPRTLTVMLETPKKSTKMWNRWSK